MSSEGSGRVLSAERSTFQTHGVAACPWALVEAFVLASVPQPDVFQVIHIVGCACALLPFVAE